MHSISITCVNIYTRLFNLWKIARESSFPRLLPLSINIKKLIPNKNLLSENMHNKYKRALRKSFSSRELALGPLLLLVFLDMVFFISATNKSPHILIMCFGLN